MNWKMFDIFSAIETIMALLKKYRAPKPKTGELKAQWGKLPNENPDLCFVWGNGVDKADGALLHAALTAKRYNAINELWEPSFLEELKERGYDVTTLNFNVQKGRRKVEKEILNQFIAIICFLGILIISFGAWWLQAVPV